MRHVDSSNDEIGDVLARELYISAGLDPTRAPGAPRVAAAVLDELERPRHVGRRFGVAY